MGRRLSLHNEAGEAGVCGVGGLDVEAVGAWGELVYGDFGRDRNDASGRFVIGWLGSGAPAEVSFEFTGGGVSDSQMKLDFFGCGRLLRRRGNFEVAHHLIAFVEMLVGGGCKLQAMLASGT
jgi:hypothetical protein